MNIDLLSSPLPRVVGVVSDEAVWRALQPTDADLVELRLDALPAEQRTLPLRVPCPRPLLVTFRHKSEGGQCEVSEEERVAVVRSLLPAVAAMDWELAQVGHAEDLLKEAHGRGVCVIGSYHDFVGMPTRELLHDLEKRAVACGADVLKVAFTPRAERDLDSALAWLREKHHVPVALMGMGDLASQSRTLFSRNGSVLLYGYLGNSPTAPGQWSASRCLSWRRDACEA